MPLWRRFCALALLSFLAYPLAAQQPADSTQAAVSEAAAQFAAGSAAFTREDYATALAAFEAAIAAGSVGPAAHYNRAVCLYRLGDFAAAETAFRELGRDFPEMRALAEYNLGLSLVRQGRDDAARAAFVTARSSGDDTVAALATAMLGRLPGGPEPGADRTIGYLDLHLGHDDNVALVDPLVLPLGQTTESPFIELTLYGDTAVGDRRRWRVAGSTFIVDYADAADYDQSTINVNARYETSLSGWTLRIGPDIGRSYIDGKGFEAYLSGMVSLRRVLSEIDATLEIGIRYDATDAIETEYAYVDGHRTQYTIGLNKSLAQSRLWLDYRLTQDDRAGAGVSADRAQLAATWRRRLTGQWFGDVLLDYRDTDYGRLVPSRSEQRSQVGFRALRDLPSSWRIAAEFRFSDNDSSDPVFDYERIRIAFGMSRVF